MKKFCLICVVFSLFCFVACGGSKSNGESEKSDSGEAAVTDDDSKDATPSDAEHAASPDGSAATDDDGFDPGEFNNDNEEPVIFAFCTEGEAGGELTTCVDDAVCETEACPDGNSCKDETECGECLNYEEKCRESDSEWGVYQCRSGQWTYLKACDHTITCENGDDGKGLITECRGKECEIVEECSGSCNRNGTACGESGCLNYTKECRDDMLTDSNGGGAIAECQFGKWEILSTCTDAASCKDANNCGECKNGNTKCVDVEVSNIMNKNCDYKGNCERDSNGNLKYYSATVGVKLLCYDGRWSDPNDLTRSSYCPPVEHTFKDYDYDRYRSWSTEMTHVFTGESTYNDFHYSSCHNDECGECHNSFKVCSDENTGGKPIGYVYLCQSGVMTHYSTCTNNICKNWYQCP